DLTDALEWPSPGAGVYHGRGHATFNQGAHGNDAEAAEGVLDLALLQHEAAARLRFQPFHVDPEEQLRIQAAPDLEARLLAAIARHDQQHASVEGSRYYIGRKELGRNVDFESECLLRWLLGRERGRRGENEGEE